MGKLIFCNSKAGSFEKFKEYLKIKLKINALLIDHYKTETYRRLRWNKEINMQKSESKILNDIEKKFGKDVVIIIGDYDKKEHMKGKEPVITKKLRRILRRRFRVYLINEFRTSKLCHKCNGEVENFLEKEVIDNEGNKRKKIVWGLVRWKDGECKPLNYKKSKNYKKNYKSYKGEIYNRDTNAVMNMRKIIASLIEKGERPKIFCRETLVQY